eukprot:1145320-Pelagomonas_calceolata.AAC.5
MSEMRCSLLKNSSVLQVRHCSMCLIHCQMDDDVGGEQGWQQQVHTSTAKVAYHHHYQARSSAQKNSVPTCAGLRAYGILTKLLHTTTRGRSGSVGSLHNTWCTRVDSHEREEGRLGDRDAVGGVGMMA